MKLYPINIVRLQYAETGQFVNRFITDFINSGLNAALDPVFKVHFDNLSNQMPTFTLALDQLQAREETLEILNLDLHRDRKITTFRRAHSVSEFTDDLAEKVAYNSIKIVLNKYKNLEKDKYEVERLRTDRLLIELRNADHLPHLQLLQLENHANKLEASNNAFKTKFDQRSTEIITTLVYDTKALRTELIKTYRDLAEYVLVMAKSHNTPYYISLLDVANNGRQYFANSLARSSGGNTPPAANS